MFHCLYNRLRVTGLTTADKLSGGTICTDIVSVICFRTSLSAGKRIEHVGYTVVSIIIEGLAGGRSCATHTFAAAQYATIDPRNNASAYRQAILPTTQPSLSGFFVAIGL